MVIRNIEAILIVSIKYIASVTYTSGAYFHPLSLNTGLAGGSHLSTCSEILIILGQVDGHQN